MSENWCDNVKVYSIAGVYSIRNNSEYNYSIMLTLNATASATLSPSGGKASLLLY